MKVIVKKVEWYGNKNGQVKQKEIFHEFNIEKDKDIYWYDFGRSYEPSDRNIKGALPQFVDFSFRVTEINEDCIVLEVGGDAGGKFDETSDKYITKIITLRLNESEGFSTKTKDFGSIYTISLSNKEESKEKMSFREFNSLFMRYLDRVEASIYAPIIYNMEDKYYDAAVKYLEENTITHLETKEFKIDDILSGYWLEKKDDKKRYLEALIILNNLEKAGEDAIYIFNPYIIE